MSNDIIRAAIESRLAAWAAAQAPALRIAYENTDFTPVAGERYLQGLLAPADTLNPSQGSRHRRYLGVYLINVRTPAGDGHAAPAALAQAVEGLFAYPTTLQQGGLNIHIDGTPSIASGRADGTGAWLVPVSVRYRADVFS